MLRNKQSFKYETPYKVPYFTVQTCINGVVTLGMGDTMGIINTRHLKT